MTKLAYWICDVFTERPLAPRRCTPASTAARRKSSAWRSAAHVVLVAHGEFQLP
jgi:hypothetical protein